MTSRDVSTCYVVVGVCYMSHKIASIYNLTHLHFGVVPRVFVLVFKFFKVGTNVMVEFVASSAIQAALPNDVTNQLHPYNKAYRRALLQNLA